MNAPLRIRFKQNYRTYMNIMFLLIITNVYNQTMELSFIELNSNRGLLFRLH